MSHLLVHQYLDHIISNQPSKIAVTDGENSLSYNDLEVFSNRLAQSLISHGVKRQDRVVFCMQRSAEVLIVILGILKADAIYVPIDCKTPPDRWQSILDDCSPAVIVCDRHNKNNVMHLVGECEERMPVLELSSENSFGDFRFAGVPLNRQATCRPNYQNCGADIAYILYTSGSTGSPKGVLISHSNIHSYIDWAVNYFQIESNDRILGTAPFHFDMSTFDIYCSLKTGCTFCIANEQATLFPNLLVNFIEQEEITLWKGISSLLMYMVMTNSVERNRMASLKQIIFSGETLPTKYLSKWMTTYPNKYFYNAYGPTEATGISLCFRVEQAPVDFQEKIPIGTPCDGTYVCLWKEDGSMAQRGEIGELCLGGSGLAQGYLNNPQKTSEAFVEIDLGVSRDIIYRTGDIATLLPCGNYQYVGRKDRQLKYMGYRIEAGEIEHALLSLCGVNDAAVVLQESEKNAGIMELVAFIESAGGDNSVVRKTQLKKHLPPYMIPKRFVQIDKMPRCRRGKISYEKLKSIEPVGGCYG